MNSDVNEQVTDVDEKMLSTNVVAPMGFEDEEKGDMIIPRIKVINLLSPECKEKIANEGDILNSLTKSMLNSRIFVPIFKFNSNILWKPRNEGGGILCQARDGKNATQTDGVNLICSACKKNEFDNTKQGRDSYPTCTKYINFFGFVTSEPIPIILSFSKTNFNEGKKLYSLAKVTMQNMWNYGYQLSSKKLAKNGNEWFNIAITMAGETTEQERNFGMNLYKQFRNIDINVDVDVETSDVESVASQEEIKSVEY